MGGPPPSAIEGRIPEGRRPMTPETLGLDPVWPVLQVAALVVGAAVLAGWLYRGGPTASTAWRGRILAALRVLAVAGIAALFLNPIRTRAEKEASRPPLLVLVDTSHSMATRDVAGKTRFEAVK